ncbi:hypothetical protein JCM18904_1676 [Vibrio sp. JCM 18904]|nr:hypothetical protein JCM18904_1676 [Vibrio sp. JCM 18904]
MRLAVRLGTSTPTTQSQQWRKSTQTEKTAESLIAAMRGGFFLLLFIGDIQHYLALKRLSMLVNSTTY